MKKVVLLIVLAILLAIITACGTQATPTAPTVTETVLPIHGQYDGNGDTIKVNGDANHGLLECKTHPEIKTWVSGTSDQKELDEVTRKCVDVNFDDITDAPKQINYDLNNQSVGEK